MTVTYYIALIVLCGIVAGGLYHKNKQNKQQEIKTILQQYMVLDNEFTPEEHTTL